MRVLEPPADQPFLPGRLADGPGVEHAMRGDQVGPSCASAPAQAREGRIHPEAVGVEQRGAPSMERPGQAWRVAERRAAEHVMQAAAADRPIRRRPLALQSSATPKISTSSPRAARALPSCATLTHTPAARRDACAVSRPIFTAAGARAPTGAPGRTTTAVGGGRRIATSDRLHQPVGKALRPPVGDDPLAGPTHRVALLVGHGGDPLHQPGQLLDVVGVEGEAVDAVPHEIGGAAAAFGDDHRQAGRHGLVDHEAPLLGGAGVDEGARRGRTRPAARRTA